MLEYTVGNCKKVLYMVILVVVSHGKPNHNIMKQWQYHTTYHKTPIGGWFIYKLHTFKNMFLNLEKDIDFPCFFRSTGGPHGCTLWRPARSQHHCCTEGHFLSSLASLASLGMFVKGLFGGFLVDLWGSYDQNTSVNCCLVPFHSWSLKEHEVVE